MRVVRSASPLALIAATLLLAAAPASFAASNPQWVEVRSPHFVVLSDRDEKSARKAAGQLERMRGLFRTLLPNAANDASLPITVFACKNRQGFESLLPTDRTTGKNRLTLDGLFLRTNDRNYILLRTDTETEHPFSTVYHEYTHFILRKAEWLPVWLNEGLAEFYQNTELTEKTPMVGIPSTNDILYLRENRLIPLNVLFAVDQNSPYYHEEDKGSVFYAESWALTHMIEITDFQAHTHRLQDYAHLLATGSDPVAAARSAFGDLDKLQMSLQAYISHGDYKQFGINTTVTADEASFPARSLPQAEVDATRADVIAHVGRSDEAIALADTAIREDPATSLAYEVKGFIAYQHRDAAAARRFYAEAVKQNSASYLAYFYFANTSQITGDNGPDVAAALKKASQLEPTFAPAYDALAAHYASTHEHLDEAHILSLKAVQLEPGEVRYRINAANVLMQQRDFASAVRVLENALPLAKSPQDHANVEDRLAQARSIAAAVERGQSAASGPPPGEAHYTGGKTQAFVTGPNGEHIPVSTNAPVKTRTFPTPAAGAAQKSLFGTIAHTTCTYPTGITFELSAKTGTITLFAADMYQIEYGTLGYISKEEIDPCKAMDGMKATVKFTAVTDPALAGQATSIQLTK